MTKLEKKIIKLLADFPEKEFYAQEIVRKLKFSKAAASGLLGSLAETGIILKETKGRMKFYRINPKSSELKRLRIDLVLEKINRFLPRLRKFSRKIILFGSASRGEQTYGSDIDLLILTDKKDKARLALKKIGRSLTVKPVLKTASEWSEMEIREPEFYQEIKSGIILYDYVPRI